ncbi:HDOD domain-containing protein [Massilia sp. W12]|uniref:EAL and HDOD domain-containing protein n=1 Tax=Massilia sp. W12 TaxID=3126507 RepID=UPI0030D3F6FD
MNQPGIHALPIAGLQPVANMKQHWVAAWCHLPARFPGSQLAPLLAGDNGLFDALGSLSLILPCPDPFSWNSIEVDKLPHGRLILALPASRCGVPSLEPQLRSLQSAGARFVVAGCLPPGFKIAPQIEAMMFDMSIGQIALARDTMSQMRGAHLASRVDSNAQMLECKAAGFSWLCGDYALQPGGIKMEATSRSRLLKLLALVARDAEARELEVLLKQDLGLSFHLLKLVNSAAFAPATPITSFTQAINVLGRRQLQRWLQLLLYARSDESGAANPLLPLAALRASLMEGLCRASGGDAAMCEKAFMSGMFSLLPMALEGALDEVIATLKLDEQVVQAILRQGGELGRLLDLVDAASRGRSLPDSGDISPAEWWQAMGQAWRWASVVIREA